MKQDIKDPDGDVLRVDTSYTHEMFVGVLPGGDEKACAAVRLNRAMAKELLDQLIEWGWCK